MFLLDVYLVVAVIATIAASVYQGYCDAKNIENKLAKFSITQDAGGVIVAAIFWPATVFILAVYLFIFVTGYPFYLVYKTSRNYFSKENE